MNIAFYVSRFSNEVIQIPPSTQCLAGYIVSKKIVNEEDILYAQNIDEIIDFNPDVVCIGSVTQTINNAISIAQKVRAKFPDCLIILGGYHISALPKLLNPVFDIGVIGEGEITLAEVLQLKKGNSLNIETLKGIKGICYYDNNEIIITDARPQIKNIDDLPFPLVRLPKDFKGAYIFTARGCPYKCIYCASNSFWGNYRYHSAEYIVNFILELYKKYNITNFYSVDDLFIAPKRRLLKIRELLEQEGLLGKLTFNGFIRINNFDEEICKALKEIGFESVRFGFETASENLLKKIKDKPFTIKQVENTINICKKYKLPVCCSLMYGIPGETKEDIEMTRQFMINHKNDLTSAGTYILQPVPGSKLWDKYVHKKFLLEGMDFSKFELDLLNPNFNWDNVLYINGENIPFNEFKEIMKGVIHDIL